MSNTREMKPLFRKPALRRLPLALLPVLVAVPASAQQRDTGVVRAVSVWQKDVDQLRVDILTQRRIEAEYQKMLQSLQLQMGAAMADSSRQELRAQASFAFNRYREANAEQQRLRRRLESLCMEIRKPEGWLGVSTTGMQAQDRRPDGTKWIKFLEPPVVASVDPGSPADRVGVRAGDVLIEIAGKQVLREVVVFSELLRPGERVVMKLQRGNEVVTVLPVVEPAPDAVTASPCVWADPGVAYVVASPAQAPIAVAERTPEGGMRYSFVYGSARPRKDSSSIATTAPTAVPAAGGGVFAGPMVPAFSGGSSVLAGLHLVTLSSESSRALGVSQGILVNQVFPGPGREAGLRGGDILVSADSQVLRSTLVLQRVINRAADRTVTLVIIRDKKRETVQLKW